MKTFIYFLIYFYLFNILVCIFILFYLHFLITFLVMCEVHSINVRLFVIIIHLCGMTFYSHKLF